MQQIGILGDARGLGKRVTVHGPRFHTCDKSLRMEIGGVALLQPQSLKRICHCFAVFGEAVPNAVHALSSTVFDPERGEMS